MAIQKRTARQRSLRRSVRADGRYERLYLCALPCSHFDKARHWTGMHPCGRVVRHRTTTCGALQGPSKSVDADASSSAQSRTRCAGNQNGSHCSDGARHVEKLNGNSKNPMDDYVSEEDCSLCSKRRLSSQRRPPLSIRRTPHSAVG